MKPLFVLFSILSLCLVFPCCADVVEYPDGYQVCTFTKPTVMKNCGQKIVVLYARDPKTKRWVTVWDDQTVWLEQYLAFPVERKSPYFSDNVHYGEELKILQPITIAFIGFKNGPVSVKFTSPPAKHKTLKDLPGKPKGDAFAPIEVPNS